MQHIYHRHQQSNPNIFVDDVCMQSSSKSFDGVLDKLVPAVDMFGDKAKLLKLTLSSKNAVTASTPKLAQSLRDELSTYGL